MYKCPVSQDKSSLSVHLLPNHANKEVASSLMRLKHLIQICEGLAV